MITLHQLADTASIRDLKAGYLRSLVAPMDGMWEDGFIAAAPHWELRWDGERAGYFAENDEGTLLQFFVLPAFEPHARALFERVIGRDSIQRAVVCTVDPAYLSLCLDVHREVSVHTYLYEYRTAVLPDPSTADGRSFRPVEASELDRAVAFQQACLGSEKDLGGWLRGYSARLIEREELFVLGREDEWLGLGEHRKSETQERIVDVGMMVAPEHRRNGWATEILVRLVAHGRARGLRPICSTTVDNVGAQKAILRAGFVSRHRILNVTL